MSDRKIKVTIDPLGNPTVEAVGFNGAGCTEATAGIEAALNSQPAASRDYKPEWSNAAEEEHEEEHVKF